MTNSHQGASPLERLKQLSPEANTQGEIPKLPTQVADKADKSPDDGNVVKPHDPTPNDYDPDLIAAGWYPKERCEKTIWRHPESGFYYSEEVARCVPEENLRNSPQRTGKARHG